MGKMPMAPRAGMGGGDPMEDDGDVDDTRAPTARPLGLRPVATRKNPRGLKTRPVATRR